MSPSVTGASLPCGAGGAAAERGVPAEEQAEPAGAPAERGGEASAHHQPAEGGHGEGHHRPV